MCFYPIIPYTFSKKIIIKKNEIQNIFKLQSQGQENEHYFICCQTHIKHLDVN